MPLRAPRARRLVCLTATVTTAVMVGAATVSCSAGGTADTAAGGGGCTKAYKGKDVRIILGVGSLSSPYWQEVIKGARATASSVGVQLTIYQSNFDGQKMLNTLTSKLASGGERTAIVVDPASNAFTKPIVQAAESAGARIVTLWNRPKDAHPWDFGGGCWVAHTSFDGVESGRKDAAALFKAIGNKGKIVALQGVPDDPPNKQRLYGLQQALKGAPNVKLLDVQTANWDPAQAQTVVQSLLAKHPDIKGIFSANDGMAVGAVEALRSKGLNGKIFVTGSDGATDMMDLIRNGDALSSMKTDAYAQGAYSVALAYATVVGDVSPQKLSHAQRDYYFQQKLVTKDNVDAVLKEVASFTASDYDYKAIKNHLWSVSAGQIDDKTWIPDVKE